jgi:hypothetical protein
MFYIDESTTLLEKTDIRGTLLLRYMTALPEITACNLRERERRRFMTCLFFVIVSIAS